MGIERSFNPTEEELNAQPEQPDRVEAALNLANEGLDTAAETLSSEKTIITKEAFNLLEQPDGAHLFLETATSNTNVSELPLAA